MNICRLAEWIDTRFLYDLDNAGYPYLPNSQLAEWSDADPIADTQCFLHKYPDLETSLKTFLTPQPAKHCGSVKVGSGRYES